MRDQNTRKEVMKIYYINLLPGIGQMARGLNHKIDTKSGTYLPMTAGPLIIVWRLNYSICKNSSVRINE